MGVFETSDDHPGPLHRPVRVPVANAIERGVRPVISKNQARKVFATLKAEPNEAGSNWSR